VDFGTSISDMHCIEKTCFLANGKMDNTPFQHYAKVTFEETLKVTMSVTVIVGPFRRVVDYFWVDDSSRVISTRVYPQEAPKMFIFIQIRATTSHLQTLTIF
jgi:hypothetical protein